MAYPAIPGLRRPFHLDGTAAYYNTGGGWAPTSWTSITGATLTNYASSQLNPTIFSLAGSTQSYAWCLFPELVDIAAVLVHYTGYTPGQGPIQYSTNTTTGADGTWTNLTFTGTNSTSTDGYSTSTDADWYRYPGIVGPSGGASTPVTGANALRFSVEGGGAMWGLNIYGDKSSGQTPDDLVFYSDSGATIALTAESDLGNVPVNSTDTLTLYLKNTSTTKTASNIALSFGDNNSADFTVSINGGTTFAATASISSMAPGAIQELVIHSAPTGTSFASRVAYLEVDPATFA